MGILKGLGILDSLSPKEMLDLEDFCQERLLNKGEELFNEGDQANSLYFLKKGGVSVFKDMDGSNTHIGEIFAEDILGEMAIFGGDGTRNATAIANQDSCLIVIMSFSIKEIAEKNPSLLSKIKQIIDHRIISNKILNSK